MRKNNKPDIVSSFAEALGKVINVAKPGLEDLKDKDGKIDVSLNLSENFPYSNLFEKCFDFIPTDLKTDEIKNRNNDGKDNNKIHYFAGAPIYYYIDELNKAMNNITLEDKQYLRTRTKGVYYELSKSPFAGGHSSLENHIKDQNSHPDNKIFITYTRFFSYMMMRKTDKTEVKKFIVDALEYMGLSIPNGYEDVFFSPTKTLDEIIQDMGHERYNPFEYGLKIKTKDGDILYPYNGQYIVVCVIVLAYLLQFYNKIYSGKPSTEEEKAKLENKIKQARERARDIVKKYFEDWKNNFEKAYPMEAFLIKSQVRLFEMNKEFVPRAQNKIGDLLPGELWIPTNFISKKGKTLPQPLRSGKNSCIIVSKTGTGKTVYTKCMVLAALQKKGFKYIDSKGNLDWDKTKSLNELVNFTDINKPYFVIYINAAMFNFCYNTSDTRDWTNDPLEMFFRVMCCTETNFNPFSYDNEVSPEKIDGVYWPETDEIRKALNLKTNAGEHILFIIDSFDEIPFGEQREKFISSLYEEKVGSWENKITLKKMKNVTFISSTRNLSKKSMNELRKAMSINETDDFLIKPLEDNDKKLLIDKWAVVNENLNSEKLINRISVNSFLKELTDTPFLLSLVCDIEQAMPMNVIEVYIDNQVTRLMNAFKGTIFEGDEDKILDELALSMRKGNNTISVREMVTIVKNITMKDNFTTADEKSLINILIANAGLIILADGSDDKLTFTSPLVRRYICSVNCADRLEEFMHTLSVEEFTGMIVPLICNRKNNIEDSIKYFNMLFTKYGKDRKENAKILQAIVDLLLAKYDSNNLSAADTSDERVLILQRNALMRILTGKELINAADYNDIKNDRIYNIHKEQLGITE